MGLFRAADGWRGGEGAKRSPFPKICHTYAKITKLDTVTAYLKKIKKIYKSHDAPL